MRLVLLGPPGAGKGTQANVLSAAFNVIHVSTGDILREAVKNKTEAGLEAKAYMEGGELVPDRIVTEIIMDRISRGDARNGFILDGFPRNKNQAVDLARQLKKFDLKLDLVLYFKTKASVSIERLSGRRICPKCGLNYHVKNRPPKNDNICDNCKERLIQRKDDCVDTIKKRLRVYEKETRPLLDYYKKDGLLREVKGDLEVETLFKDLKILFKKESLI